MPRIKWSQRALRDLIRHFDFLNSRSHEAAARAIRAIRQGARILASHPEIGRPVGDRAPKLREWIIEFGHGAYVLLYLCDVKEVVILSVRHNREME